MFIGQIRGCFFVEDLCFCAVISSRACSSAWLERIPDKDEAGGSSPPRPTISTLELGGLAQLVERLLCKQEVSGSTPLSSTRPGCFSAWSNGQVILKGWSVYYSIIGF